MTSNVKKVLAKISNAQIFREELYFTGGTALAYYLNHRISEDIDIVSAKVLPYKKIIPSLLSLGANQIEDENVTALKIAGLFPDEYMIKFVIDEVKLEFFQANRNIQQEILFNSQFVHYENSNLKILDVKSIAKLKIVALIMRNKSRDLFDFGAILKNNILSIDEVIELFSKIDKSIVSIDDIAKFIISKKEPKDDESVYLSESFRVNLTFEEIKNEIVKNL